MEGGEAWVTAWLADRLVRGLTSTRENESHYREHVVPVLGDKHVRDWTSADMRALCASLDAKVQAHAIAWKTATNIWGTATRMCSDACESKITALRVRTSNPSTGVRGPDRGERKVKQYLWPSEFLRFVGCGAVPLAWRRLVALAAYIYGARCRAAARCDGEDVDLGNTA